jgi:hypothetical protein
MIVAYDNSRLDASTITASSAFFEVTNLQDTRLSKVWRSTGKASENIVFDMGSAFSATSIFLAGTNFPYGTGITITIQANATNAWGSPSFSQALTFTAASTMPYALFAAQNYRYWRLVLAGDPTGVTYFEIGRVFIGNYVTFPAVLPGIKIPKKSTGLTQYSITGQAYGDEGVTYRAFTCTMPVMSETERQTVLAFFNSVTNVGTFFLAIWENDLSTEPVIYAILDQDSIEFSAQPQAGLAWQADLKIREIF